MPSFAREVAKIVIYAVLAVILVNIIDILLSFFFAQFPAIEAYRVYIRDASVIVIALIIAYLISGVINKGISSYTSKRVIRRGLRGVHILIRTLIFVVALIWALSAIGVNISAAVLGGSIGGIVVGFALQTVLENLLSGVMASSSGVIVPGQYTILYSWLFASPIVGQVLEVRTLWSTIKTVYGNIISVPNSALIGSTTFTDIKDNDSFVYKLDVTVNGDVNSSDLKERVVEIIEKSKIEGLKGSGVYFASKNGANNTFTVRIELENFDDLPNITSRINGIFESTYWELKSKAAK
ncbi:MAG: mechanosensitive ion channel family protein [Thermoplasmataceae archaeon]